jgi:DNA polymerase-1
VPIGGAEGTEVLLSSDYSQMELRILAAFSGDANLAQAFKDADKPGGIDFFTGTGARMYSARGWSGDKDPRRNLIKSSLYAKVYGGGAAKIAATAGVSVQQVKDVIDTLYGTYPKMAALMQVVERRTNSIGKVVLPSGRMLPTDGDRAYSGLNYLIQGHCAEMMKLALIECDRAGLGDYLLLPVHDELVMSVPDDEDLIGDVKHTVSDCMKLAEGQAINWAGVSDSATDGCVVGSGDVYSVCVPVDPEGGFYRWGDKVRG